MTIQIDKNEKLHIKYIRLDKLNQWSKNPKLHDIEKITKSIAQNGFQDPGKLTNILEDEEVLIFGNGRVEAVIWMFRQKWDVPKGIAVDSVDEMWCLPVLIGNDFDNVDKAIAFALDHNLIGGFGGDNTHLDVTRVYDSKQYLKLAIPTVEHSVTADREDLNLMTSVISGSFEDKEAALSTIPNTKNKMPSYNVRFLVDDDRDRFIELLKPKVLGCTDGEYLLELLQDV